MTQNSNPKIYYCERFDKDEPQFLFYKGRFYTDASALAFFKEKHGDQLQCVYDEDFKMILENKG